MFASDLIDRPHGGLFQPNAPGGAADQVDDAFAGQGLEVLFRRIGRLEAQFVGDFSPCGRGPLALDRDLDQRQYLLLPLGEFGGFIHVGSPAQGLMGVR